MKRIAVVVVAVLAGHVGSFVVRSRSYDNDVVACGESKVTEAAKTPPSTTRRPDIDAGVALVEKMTGRTEDQLVLSLATVACDDEMGGGPSFWTLP